MCVVSLAFDVDTTWIAECVCLVADVMLTCMMFLHRQDSAPLLCHFTEVNSCESF
jgi:hypothetical protein